MIDSKAQISFLLKHYSEEELAMAFNVTTRSLQNYKNGSEPHKKTKDKIEELYNRLKDGADKKEIEAVLQSRNDILDQRGTFVEKIRLQEKIISILEEQAQSQHKYISLLEAKVRALEEDIENYKIAADL